MAHQAGWILACALDPNFHGSNANGPDRCLDTQWLCYRRRTWIFYNGQWVCLLFALEGNTISSKASAVQTSLKDNPKRRQPVPLLARHAEMQDANEEVSSNTSRTSVDGTGGVNGSDSAEQWCQWYLYQTSSAALFSALAQAALSPNLILGPIWG